MMMLKRFLLLFVLAAVTPCAAMARDDAIKEVEFADADVYELASRYPYLKSHQRDHNRFAQAFPDARPFVVQTAKVKPQSTTREYFIIRESSSMLCGIRSCPLRVFDITDKEKQPRMVLEVLVPPLTKLKDCPNRFAFLFLGDDDRWIAWVPGNQKFKPYTAYATLDDAAVCDE